MANYYIGGVGYVSAFTKDENGNPIHYFDARTLTDSSINISVSSEEIRGGEGAQLLGRFFHTSVFNLSMTDALFDLKYLAAQVGSEINDGAAGSKMEHKTIATPTTPLNPLPVAPIEGSDKAIVWIELSGKNITFIANAATGVISDPDNLLVGQTNICVNYFSNVDNCRQIIVNANYQPSEFTVYLRAKLFSGDACKPSKGQAIGEIVIEIPRFQLDGAIDLAMAMASPATFALNGSALASGCDCDGKMWYAKITEIMYNEAEEYTGYTDILVLNNDELADGDVFKVFAFGPKKLPKLMPAEQYTVEPASAVVAGKCVGQAGQATNVTVTVKNNVAILKGETATATIAAKA